MEREKSELLQEWGKIAKNHNIMHMKSSKYFQTLNLVVLIPNIILSTLYGAVSLTNIVCSLEHINYILGFMGLGSAALSTLQGVLNLGERAEQHKLSADSFEKMARDITVETLLAESGESTFATPAAFIKAYNDRFNHITDASPTIPDAILKNHHKPEKITFQQMFNPTNIQLTVTS